MITKQKNHPGYVIIEFIDLKRFTLSVAEEIKAELKPTMQQGNNNIILNFQEVNFIDSSGIGCLISLIKTAKSNQCEIMLCNLSVEVMSILEILHLPMILNIKEDVKSCLETI